MREKVYKDLRSLGIGAALARFFVECELPFFRKSRSRKGRQWPHIEVGGDCLRVGKTTAKQVLAEQIGRRGLPFVFSDEEWKGNMHLKKAYEGSSESLLKSQKWFVKKKKEQLGTISDSSFWIQVVHPEMDFGYAMTNFLVGNLSRKQFDSYWKYYQSLGWSVVPAPDLLVYLTASAEVLVERFRKIARDFEKADDVYVRVMKIVNQRWLGLARGRLPLLVVETDDFDFSYESGGSGTREKLGKMVFEKLTEDGWEFDDG